MQLKMSGKNKIKHVLQCKETCVISEIINLELVCIYPSNRHYL